MVTAIMADLELVRMRIMQRKARRTEAASLFFMKETAGFTSPNTMGSMARTIKSAR